MPTRCPNLKDDKVREDWNHILTRLGGRAMSAADVAAPRQAYVGDLSDKQKRAYFQAHALWDGHDSAAEVMKFLDAVNDLRGAIGRPEKEAPEKSRDIQPESRDVSREKTSTKTEQEVASRDVETESRDISEPKRDLPELFAEHLAAGNRFETIVQARKFAQDAGHDLSNKHVEEALEAGVVAAARGIAARGVTPSTVFADLVDLYRRQPRLGARTGTSVTNQAYSTPVPLAYAASRLAGVANADVVYEPTAGNGALLIEADPKSQKVIANEIDQDRASALKAQGFQATQRDGADPSQGKAIRNAAPADAVIMNPPFGAVREGGQSKEFTAPDGWKTTQIDHAIAMNGLQAMGDNGKAVLILGGINAEDVTERRAGYRAKAKREFYYRLYDQYKVTDHFTVDGALYEKQGAGWPVDVVVIDGRGKSDRPLPAAAPPPILKTWDEVGAKITDGIQPTARAQTGRDRAQDRGPAETVELAAGRDGGSGQTTLREGGGRDQRVRKVRGEDIPGQVRLGSSEQRGGDQLAERPGLGRVASPTDRQPGRTDRPSGSESAPRRRLIGKPNSSGQISYPPASARGDSIKALVPANIAEATVSALDRVVERHGSVDTLVADRLGYDEASLGKHFSPEQIDALALGIDNIERGGSLVLGDAGGIGKGRVNAGMLRYAKRRGWTPVFVTETKDLYGDMVRDMEDIGMSEFLGREPRIFMTDSGEIVPLDDTALAWKEAADQAKQDGRPIPKKEGKFLRSGGAPRQTAIMNEIAAGKSPFDFVFTTYNQMNTVKGADTDRRRFLKQIAPNAMIVADEVHNAGGAGQGGWKKAGAAQNRAEFMRDLVSNAKAVLYSSATYAKRPEVMDLYARTDLGEAVDDPKKLPELISRGGVPMQQIVATMLSNSGQYIRRERSMEGVDYDVDPVAVDAKSYGDFSGAVQAIFRFDIAFEDQRKETMKDLLDSKGWKVSKDTGVGGGSASSISFSSIMHNVVNQMLLGIKSDQVANRAIAAHAKGEKPVITVSGTAESFISDYAASEGVASGSPIDISFRDVLSRYLSRTLRITLTDPNGNKSHHQIPVSDLSTAFQRQYRDTLDRINEGDFAAIPVSPIDWMRHRMSASGLRVAEITGRKTMIDYGSSPPRLVARPKRELGPAGKRGSIRLFNAGELDGMIINQSGSTGVSMHAYYKFKDQKPRRMIIAQPEGNIDTQMQMLWRIDRTGQVVKPRYSQLAAEIPAEARPAAVLMKKMASLNANTTGARKSVFMKDSLDFLNEYGDKVVGDILHADSDTNWKLGNPVGVDENGRPKIEDAARKATGRLVLLPPEEQQSFLDRIQSAYKEYIEQLDQLGENALEAKTLDLQARTLETSVIRDRQGDGPFLDAVNMEKVSVKASGRAMEPAEVIDGAAKGLGIGNPAAEPAQALDQLQQHGRDWVRNKIDDIRKIASEWAQKDVADRPEASREKAKQEHQATFTRWRDIVATAYPGSRIRLGMPSGDIDGVVLSIKRRSGTKNPVALSGWDVTFAVPSSDRQITFPMSRLFTPAWQKPEGAIGANIERSRVSASDLVEAFDQARKEGRETRHMITGNILAGYDAANGNGQVVNYTTESGELKPGILMKRGFDSRGFMASRKVAFKTADQITSFLETAPPMATVTSTDSVITLRNHRGGWMIETPASRAVGGKYYTEPSVREAVKPSEFERTGKVMKVEGLNRARFHSAVEALQKLGAVFTTDTEQEKALEIIRGTAPPPNPGAMYSVRPAATPRRLGVPVAAREPIASYRDDKTVKAHPDYTAAKAGNIDAAIRAVRSLVPDSDLQRAQERFGSDVVYLPVIAKEQSGYNKLPLALAELYASATGANTEAGIGQSNQAFHTGAGPMERIANRAIFRGDVKRGSRYVLVDDVTVMGSTLADLADHIQKNGGEVAGVVTLVNAGRSATLTPSKAVVRDVERRFGNAVREIFGVDPSSLTADEAAYLRNFRNADELRVRVDAAKRQRSERLRAKGIREDAEGGGRLASLTRAKAGIEARETGPFDYLADEKPRLTPVAQAKRAELIEELRGIVRHVVGPNVDVEFYDEIPLDASDTPGWGSYGAEAKTASGTYLPADRIIQLALSDPRYAGIEESSAFHESWHAVEHLLMDERERKLAENPREVDRLRDIISQQFGFTREQAAEMAGSEVRAQAFEVYRAAREAGARDFAGMHVGIRRFFEKVYNLLRRVRNWLAGRGFKTMDDLFERAYRGEFAEREAAPLKTPQEFVDGRASVRAPDDHVVRIMRELAKNDDLFGYPKSQARDFSTVLHDVDPTVKYSGTVTDADALDHGATRGHIVESSSGKEERSAIIYEDDARVWVSLPGRETGTGGSAIYAAIADYAFNNGKVFIGDPAGLTLTGLQRRTEAMLSSALKHGTTSHLEPHPFQVDPPDHYRSSGVVPLRWTAGDDIGNIRSLIETSVDLLAHHVPEIRNASYDFASGTFRTGEGKPITDGAFREWRHTSPGVRAASAGRRTLKRGILLDTILREEGGERPGLLERLVRQSDKLVAGSQLAGAFYSIRSDGAPGRRSGPVMPNVRPTSPRSGRGGLTMPHESVRTAWRDPTLTRRERLSTAIDAMLLRPSRALWDKFIDLSRLQRAAELASGENIAENLDVHLAATLYPGRAGERMKDAALKLYSPLFNAMKERGVTRDDLHEYLYARHAPERNKQIRKIDPNNNAGSGMTDDEAAEIMARFADRSGDFEAVADLVDRIVAHNRDLDESAGLESPETIDAWRKTYKVYVPLKGAEASESEQIEIGSPPVGQGFDVRRPESRRALGRFSRADDILDNLLDQTQRTIIRAEKNRVGSAFLRFAQANPSPLYKIGLAEKERRINPKTGLVETYTKVASSEAPHVFAVKEGGETYHIQIEHEGLLTALKNLGMERLPGFMRPIAAYTRWYASLQTAKNPEFMLTNFMRDLQDAAFNLTAEQKAGFRTAFTKHIINGKALLAVMHAHVKDADNKLGRWAKDKDPKLAKLYDEWRLEGGKISTFGYKDLEAIKKDIERELAERTRRGVKKLGVRAWRTIDPFQGYVVKAFEGISDVSESTTRFAIYAAARDVGLSKAQAAKAARSMTVDFSMKGTAGPYIQALYAFANPQIQGTVNLVQRLAKSKRMRRAFLGVAGIGFMLAVWNLMAAPDDDDGKNLYAKRPYWEREKNFIFYFPGQEKPLSIPAAKVPMGYALQIAMMMGENAAMAMMGKTDPLEALGNWLGTLAKSFNPLGGEGSLFSWRTWLAMASPTATDLPLELALNKNWLGYPIHPNEGPWTKGTPHSEQSKASTSPTAASAARLINRATGGSIFQKGAVDLYPDDIEYIVGWATGGFGRFMKNNFDMFYNIATGNETPVEKIPFARRFLIPGESIQVEKNDFYRASDAVQEKSQALRAAIKAKANKTNVEDADRTIREYGPPLGFHPNSRGPRGGVLIPAEKTFREANKQLRDLHDEEREIQSDQSLSAAARRHKLDKNKKAQMQIMRSTRMTYEDMQKSGSGGSQPWRNATRQILESVRQRKKQTAYDLDDDDNDND